MRLRHPDHDGRSVRRPRQQEIHGLARVYRRGARSHFRARCRARSRPGLQRPDQFGHVQHLSARHRDRRRHPGHSRLHQLPRAGRLAARRILRARPVRYRGHGHSRGRERTGHRLRRPRDEFHLHLHSRGLPPARRQVQRSFAEIFPAGLFRHGILPVRHRHGLRRYRHHQNRRNSGLSRRAILAFHRSRFSAWASSSSGSDSKSSPRRSRSTVRTCTKALPLRSLRCSLPVPRQLPLPSCCAFLWWPSAQPRISGSGPYSFPPCSPCSSAISPLSCRPT